MCTAWAVDMHVNILDYVAWPVNRKYSVHPCYLNLLAHIQHLPTNLHFEVNPGVCLQFLAQ